MNIFVYIEKCCLSRRVIRNTHANDLSVCVDCSLYSKSFTNTDYLHLHYSNILLTLFSLYA